MATCKDCVHFDVCCSYLSTAYNKCKLATPDFKLLKNIECDECQHFNDRSRFVELPCKVGDAVFSNVLGKMLEDKITSINIYENGARVLLGRGLWFDIEYIGSVIFLTREEAEQALKEREKNETT